MAQIILLAVMIGVMYLVLIRPQQKRLKEQQQLIAGLDAGDDVITSGGIHGTITEVDDDAIFVEVAQGLELKLARDAVTAKIPDPNAVSAEDTVDDLDSVDSAD